MLTRRQRNMGFFPRAWVFPGGHLEVDEGLDECALREFFEETGVKVTVHKRRGSAERTYSHAGQRVAVTPFFAFESTTRYDARDPKKPGPPRTSHLIVFFKVRLAVPCSEIALLMQPSEVEACAWLNEEQCRQILAASPSVKDKELEHCMTMNTTGDA